MEKPRLIKDLGMLSPTPISKYTIRFGLYECPYCKETFTCRMQSIETENTKSCGCSTKKLLSKSSSTHKFSKTKLYKKYLTIKARCYNKNFCQYMDYGGRGIYVEKIWLDDFTVFKDWALENGYDPKLEIDRIDNDGPYGPLNCRWVTHPKNNQNSRLLRSTNMSGYRGVRWDKRIKKWAASIGWNNNIYFLGNHSNILDAARAYNKFVIDNKTAHPLNPIPDEDD